MSKEVAGTTWFEFRQSTQVNSFAVRPIQSASNAPDLHLHTTRLPPLTFTSFFPLTFGEIPTISLAFKSAHTLSANPSTVSFCALLIFSNTYPDTTSGSLLCGRPIPKPTLVNLHAFNAGMLITLFRPLCPRAEVPVEVLMLNRPKGSSSSSWRMMRCGEEDDVSFPIFSPECDAE